MDIYITPHLLKAQVSLQKRKWERSEEPGVGDVNKETVFSTHDGIVAHMNSEQLRQHTQHLWKLKLDKLMEGRKK